MVSELAIVNNYSPTITSPKDIANGILFISGGSDINGVEINITSTGSATFELISSNLSTSNNCYSYTYAYKVSSLKANEVINFNLPFFRATCCNLIKLPADANLKLISHPTDISDITYLLDEDIDTGIVFAGYATTIYGYDTQFKNCYTTCGKTNVLSAKTTSKATYDVVSGAILSSLSNAKSGSSLLHVYREFSRGMGMIILKLY